MARSLKRASLAVLLAATAACTRELPQDTPPRKVVARFDPAANPPLVPLPNDLATDPKTGLLAIAAPKSGSAIDAEFAAYLSTLDGFPPSSPATAQFDGQVAAASVAASSVRVFDLTDGNAAVEGTARHLLAVDDVRSGLQVDPPAGGWKSGHTYAVALIGGAQGLKGAAAEPVVGSPTWSLLRGKSSLVTCADLAQPDCRSATDLIPSDQEEPTARIADQGRKARQLEALRRKYAPTLDLLESSGVPRSDVALAWTFKVQANSVVAAFAPNPDEPCLSVIPTPTDLAIDPETGLVNAPVGCPGQSEAEIEFTEGYLNQLHGFPVITPGRAPVLGGNLVPASVNHDTVQVIDLDDPEAFTGDDLGTLPRLSWDATRHAVVVAPPEGGWVKGHHYAAALLGGSHGAQGEGGKPLVASDLFAFLRSENSLVDEACEELDPETCVSQVSLVPLDLERVLAIEQLRRDLSPAIDALADVGVVRSDIAVAWTFSVQADPEMNFVLDPEGENSVIPFPNDLLYASGSRHVSLPNPENDPLLDRLNRLDGFSTTGVVTSENAADLGPLTDGAELDPDSLYPVFELEDGGTEDGAPTAGLINLDPEGYTPSVEVCVGCTASLQSDGGDPLDPLNLEFVPVTPLAEASQYAGYVTRDTLDLDGNNVAPTLTFALMRMRNPLIADGVPTVPGLGVEQATALERLRLLNAPMFDALEEQGLERSQLALAWSFTTQSTTSELRRLHQLVPVSGTTTLASTVSGTADVTATAVAAMEAGRLPHTNIGKVLTGMLPIADALTRADLGGELGTDVIGLSLDPARARFRKAPFTLVLPDDAAEGDALPVVLFSHGATRSKDDLLSLANALAGRGFASIAIDQAWHGERSSCAGSRAALGAPSDDAACANPATQRCDSNPTSATFGRCIKRTGNGSACDAASIRIETGGLMPGDLYCRGLGEGLCLSQSGSAFCEGGTFRADTAGRPLISGWNFFNVGDLFAIRSNYLQNVMDLAQLERAVKLPEATAGSLNAALSAAGLATLDGEQIHFVGQSNGALTGALFTAASGDVQHSVLNAGGGDLVQVLLETEEPALVRVRSLLLDGLAARGLVPGTAGYDFFLHSAHWILDAADPLNAIADTTRAPWAPEARSVLLQNIKGDRFIVDSRISALIDAAYAPDEDFVPAITEYDPSTSLLPVESRHGFLLNFAYPLTTRSAQNQVATFLVTGEQP